MSIHVGLTHRTSYRFDRPVALHPHQVRLRPAPHARTPILAYSLTVSPQEHFLNWQQDPFGNWVARLVFPDRADHLEVTVDLVADLATINPFDFFVEDDAREWPFDYDPALRRDLGPYLAVATDEDPLVSEWLRAEAAPNELAGASVIDNLVRLNRALADDVAYSIRMEPGVQTPAETLTRAVGSCRDSAWLLIELLRRLGLAARFASGYLVQLQADQPSLDGPSGPTADFTDLHAWAEVFLPGAGWVGLDPTSGLLAGEGHIPLACTPHPSGASPISGSTGVAEVVFDFSNEVRRVHEPPRVTLPYRPDQWERIDALGRHVDERLRAGDVRLTMGGEPTFVSIDDMEGAEWTTDADGEAKRDRARALAAGFAEAFGVSPLIRFGQGKQYPGEPLPRWEIELLWRRDGVAVWPADAPQAAMDETGDSTPADAHAVLAAIAARFGLDQTALLAAHEDPVVTAHLEARRPSGEPLVDDAAELDRLGAADDAAERARAIASLDVASHGEPVGWVLPLHPDASGTGWLVPEWRLRRNSVFLLPGTAPIGLRLPLDSLTWSPQPSTWERSLFEPRASLPADPLALVVGAKRCASHEVPPTAITCQVIDGHVAVFLPPLPEAEHGLALVAAVAAAATDLDTPVRLVGYPLAADPRLRRMSVTPDPGVVEVNVMPSADWPELCSVIDTVYEQARLARLGTEKFAIDGSHTGTGGGNHVTIGAETPESSPVLRRPDLLRSLVTFWQRHPSLSYLFAGPFIGPTSQAPRVDEGRVTALDDLELAFAELDRFVDDDTDPPLWLADRLLRHLLTDLTGNTHRAEFCIDKLFSPDVAARRLGVVELRAFEMPPHPQMALTQALLIRSLVASFWEVPYRAPLIRWGSDLHDRFLLPSFVERDLDEVVAHLAGSGIDFERAWLDPFVEFRFPLIGRATAGSVSLEVRRAIEPWLVLGEEATSSGTSRYVDSSVERLQLTVTGLDAERQRVLCNGVPVPLHAGSERDRSIAGIRFKAWDPWSAMHPTIGVHAPLIFEVVDVGAGRSLGGCTYRVSHPGGRNYTTYPVNAAEAETRRRERFDTIGHTPGLVDVAAIEAFEARLASRTDAPLTLDLRQFPAATAEVRAAAARSRRDPKTTGTPMPAATDRRPDEAAG